MSDQPDTQACAGPCAGCALTEGAAANLEPHNHMRATLCVLGPIPFWCHAGIKWEKEHSNCVTPAEFRAQGRRICAGWRREVARLAEVGYYKDNPEITRFFAQLGLGQLAILCADGPEEIDKEAAKDRLARIFKRLVAKRRKCTNRAMTRETHEQSNQPSNLTRTATE